MTDILQTIQMHFLEWKSWYFDQTSLKFIFLGPTDNNSVLVQIMVGCHTGTSHYLNQYRQRSMVPYGVTRPQCVNPHSGNGIF